MPGLQRRTRGWHKRKPPPGTGIDWRFLEALGSYSRSIGLVFCTGFLEGSGGPFDAVAKVRGTISNPSGTSKWIIDGKNPLIGPVFNFDGVNDLISWPDAAYLRPGTNAMSLIIWANPAADAVNAYCLFSKDTAANGNGWVFQANVTDLGTISSGSISFTAQTNATNFIQSGTSAGATIVDGDWHIFGVSFDGTNPPQIYQDGVAITQSHVITGTYAGMSNTDSLVVGNVQGGGQGGLAATPFSVSLAAYWIHPTSHGPLTAKEHRQLFEASCNLFQPQRAWTRGFVFPSSSSISSKSSPSSLSSAAPCLITVGTPAPKAQAGNATSVTIPSFVMTQGNTVVVAVSVQTAHQDLGQISVSDGVNTYVNDLTSPPTANFPARFLVFHAANVTGGTRDITVQSSDPTADKFWTASAINVGGLANPVIDVLSTDDDESGAMTTVDTANTQQTSQPCELAVAGFADESTVSETITDPPSGYTSMYTAMSGTFANGAADFRIITGVETPTPTWTSGGKNWTSGVVTFKSGSPPSPTSSAAAASSPAASSPRASSPVASSAVSSPVVSSAMSSPAVSSPAISSPGASSPVVSSAISSPAAASSHLASSASSAAPCLITVGTPAPKAQAGNATSVTIPAFTMTQSNMVVVIVSVQTSHQDLGAISVSDGVNTYVNDLTSPLTANFPAQFLVFHAANVTGGTRDITVQTNDPNADKFWTVSALNVGGLPNPVIDVLTTHDDESGTNTNVDTTNTQQTSQPCELAVTGFADESIVSETITDPPSGYTSIYTATSGTFANGAADFRIIQGIETPAPTWTSGGKNWTAGVVTFKSGPAPSPGSSAPAASSAKISSAVVSSAKISSVAPSSAISSPKVSSPTASSAVSSPRASSAVVSSPGVSSPAVSSPAVSSARISSAGVSSPGVSSPLVSSVISSPVPSPLASSPLASSPLVSSAILVSSAAPSSPTTLSSLVVSSLAPSSPAPSSLVLSSVVAPSSPVALSSAAVASSAVSSPAPSPAILSSLAPSSVLPSSAQPSAISSPAAPSSLLASSITVSPSAVSSPIAPSSPQASSPAQSPAATSSLAGSSALVVASPSALFSSPPGPSSSLSSVLVASPSPTVTTLQGVIIIDTIAFADLVDTPSFP